MPGTFYIEQKKVREATEKLRGRTIEDSAAGSWHSGTAPSGEAGDTLLILGEPGVREKVHSLLVDIGGLTPGATITVKLFTRINGVERKVYPPPGTSWVVGTDPDGVWVINGTLAIHDELRVEVESDNAADDGKGIGYTAVVEEME